MDRPPLDEFERQTQKNIIGERRWTAGQMDEVRLWKPGLEFIYRNLFRLVFNDLTFVSINSMKR